ncbi:hypothetical protein [Limnochorda pilosa]|uniref:hypothetical protein n=1 Tax=Limnochorda pilosa TaxID=1555112 RepID=UPI00082A6D0A|nr:hypothetical protein [Limnochorda pilosa]
MAHELLALSLWLAATLVVTAIPVRAQDGGPLLAGGGGPTLDVLLLDPEELSGAPGLPEMLLLQGGGGFGRYQAWRVGGSGAAGQVGASDGATFGLSYGGLSFAYLPGAYGALPLPSPRTSFGALFGLGAATLQPAGSEAQRLPFILFRPEATAEISLGSLGTLQLGATYSFPIPLGSEDTPLGDLGAIQRPGFRLGLVFGGF